MANLVPAPSSLNFASPALGPWFAHATDPMPTLALPNEDLSVSVTLTPAMDWLAPTICTRSYVIATAQRPMPLRNLRQADGGPAFATGALVVLLTLLPESELRLWNLTQAIPSPDNSAVAGVAAPVGSPARPRIRYLALEVTAGTLADVLTLHPDTLPGTLSTSAQQASYLGLSTAVGLSNATSHARELRKPDSGVSKVITNGTSAALSTKLWCFDFRGRAIDPGAVANWWAFMVSTGIWENLWQDGTPQTLPAASGGTLALPTTSVTTGRVVQITNAHEGPVDASLLGRLTRSDLSAIGNASDLFTAGANPTITLSSAPTPDLAPMPRIAALPLGNYAAPGTATPFAGWNDSAFPDGLGRDFLRIGALDLERQTVGLDRTDAGQANARIRVSPAPNSVAQPVLSDGEAVIAQAMTVLSGGLAAEIMAPVMDPLWGAVTPPALGTDSVRTLPAALAPIPIALDGEGTNSAGGSVADQIIALHFLPGSLPANAWVRIWTHGLDTDTGRRFKQDGGGGLADAFGEAYVVVPLPDGVAAPDDPADDPVLLSFDALVTLATGSVLYADQRFVRPEMRAGSRVNLQSPATGTSLWVAEQGTPFSVGNTQFQSGHHILAIRSTTLALGDLSSLLPADMAANTLPRAAQAGDRIIVTEPAFGQTPDGNIESGSNAATLKKHERTTPASPATMGRPAPSQERRELVAHDRTAALGVIGATPARDTCHANPPMQTGHVGVPASAEIRGPGIALAGPAADLLVPLMDERGSDTLADFLERAGTPPTAAATPASPSTWAAILETTTYDVTGESIVRSFLDQATFQQGQTWLSTKESIESATGEDIDALIDTSGFDDDTLARAVDRMILKTRDGTKGFANALLDAINRAEDFIYVETPAIDPLAAEGGLIDIVGAINARLAARPGLVVMLCVPEKFLPKQTAKLETIRGSLVGAALLSLQGAGTDRVALFAPIAGPGRRAHLATTTVIVDDAILLSGSTHLWRRGLTFDSALSVALFDETVTNGRPAAVRAARLQFMGDALGLPIAFLPEDPEDCLNAIASLNRSGGGGRVKPGAYPPASDATSTEDQAIWNPDGRRGFSPDWAIILADLTGGANTEFNNAIR